MPVEQLKNFGNLGENFRQNQKINIRRLDHTITCKNSCLPPLAGVQMALQASSNNGLVNLCTLDLESHPFCACGKAQIRKMNLQTQERVDHHLFIVLTL